MVAATEDASTMPTGVQAKEQIVTTTTEPEEPRDDDDVAEREDEATEEEESTTEEAEQRQPSTPKIKKFGFGAGMRMYAKSLAEAEKLTVEEPKETVVEDKALEPTSVSEVPTATDATTAEATEEETAAPEVAAAAAGDEDATAETEEVVEVLLSEDEQRTSVNKATGVVVACGSIYQQFVDGVAFFLRKTEDGLDDVHEKVCSRDIGCAADLDNEIIDTGDKDGAKELEETEEKEEVPQTTESDADGASPVESN